MRMARARKMTSWLKASLLARSAIHVVVLLALTAYARLEASLVSPLPTIVAVQVSVVVISGKRAEQLLSRVSLAGLLMEPRATPVVVLRALSSRWLL